MLDINPKNQNKILRSKAKSNEGISLLFVILIMSVILAIGLGISAILAQQTRMMVEIGNSVVSFYVADTGIEKVLYDLFKSVSPQPSHSGSIGSAVFEAIARCGKDVLPENCPAGFTIDSNCSALNFCIKSIGSYQKTKRAIETQY